MLRILLAVLALAVCVPAQTEFEKPFKVMAGEEAVDVPVGHAAPFFVDFDGDGLEDLLVGQFGKGRLRIYKNVGKAGAPAFETFVLFKAGGDVVKVPSG